MSRTIYPALIIGAGASGLFAGSILGRKALILEKNQIPGKKLLLTGGGRCNYTHSASVPELLSHYNCSQNYLKRILYRLPPSEIISYFRSLGIEESIEDNGKVFPKHGDASSISEALAAGCNIEYGVSAERISREDGVIAVETDSGIYYCNNLIIAAGCSAYPKTGSDGKALDILKAAGIECREFTAAMAPLELERKLSDAEGITLDISIKAGKKIEKGSAVITRRGISGPAAQNISYLLEERNAIEIRFIDITKEELLSYSGKLQVKNAISLPPRLLSALLGPIAQKRIGNLTRSDIDKTVRELTAFRTEARAIREASMTSYGGALLSGFNLNTMESKAMKGLYAAGDILEPSADCGGYSLTFAFATAYIAAISIKEQLE